MCNESIMANMKINWKKHKMGIYIWFTTEDKCCHLHTEGGKAQETKKICTLVLLQTVSVADVYHTN